MDEVVLDRKPEVEPNEAKKDIGSLAKFIPEQFAEVLAAELDWKTANEINKPNAGEAYRIARIEYFGLIVFAFAVVEKYLVPEDQADYDKYTKILYASGIDQHLTNLTLLLELMQVSTRILKNSGLASLTKVSRLKEIRAEIDMEEI